MAGNVWPCCHSELMQSIRGHDTTRKACFVSVIAVRDLTPNTGLFWYMFTEAGPFLGSEGFHSSRNMDQTYTVLMEAVGRSSSVTTSSSFLLSMHTSFSTQPDPQPRNKHAHHQLLMSKLFKILTVWFSFKAQACLHFHEFQTRHRFHCICGLVAMLPQGPQPQATAKRSVS